MTSFVHNDALRTAWYPVAQVSDIADRPYAVRLLAQDLVVWRGADGALVVAPDRCPHREAPLSIGTVTNGELACAYHGWTFGSAGTCVAIPSSMSASLDPPTTNSYE